MPEVFNTQRKIPLDTSLFTDFILETMCIVTEAYAKELAIAFISDRRMKQLNQFFCGIDSTTDVLSFPHKPEEFEIQPPAATGGSDGSFLGDIVISAEQAQKQAAENGLTLENEIKQLILHGVLHLCGYDHETDNGEMNARELALRKKLSI